MKKWNELARARMKARKITQDQLAEHLGVTQGAVAHWMGGRREPSFEVIDSILQYVGLPPALRDDTLAVDADSPRSDEVRDQPVPTFEEFERPSGKGLTDVVETKTSTARISFETLRVAGVNASNAACAQVRDRSMEKLIPEGSTVGFDRADISIIDGEIYAFDHGGLLRVKYLYRLPAGAVRIRSENYSDYPDETLSADQYRQDVRMLGRVFWWSAVRRPPNRS